MPAAESQLQMGAELNAPGANCHALQVKPTHVFNAAGVTGRPNVDWCETHKVR